MRFHLAAGPKHHTIPCQQITACTLAISWAVLAASPVGAVGPAYHFIKARTHTLGSQLVGLTGLSSVAGFTAKLP